jgi:hypothetical protein
MMLMLLDKAFFSKKRDVYGRRSRLGAKLVLGEGVVGITVKPVFAGLRGRNHGVTACLRMFGRMVIRRTIAAESHAALLTDSEMNP